MPWINVLRNWFRISRRTHRISVLERLFYYLITVKWTAAGSMLTLSLILTSMVSLQSLELPVYRLLIPLGLLWCIPPIVGALMRPTLRVVVRTPGRALAGHEVVVTCSVTNVSTRPAWDFGMRHFNLPDGITHQNEEEFRLELRPNETVQIELKLRATRRGVYRIHPPLAYSAFPFRLWRMGAKLVTLPVEETLIVLPDFHPVSDMDLEISPRHQPGGIALASHVGESSEYIGNREYRPGDPIRHIDFRSWARLAQPTIREYQEEYFCRIALVLDSFVPRTTRMTSAGYPALEAAIALSASISDVLTRGEHVIDLVAVGSSLHVMRTGRHRADFNEVLEILACVEPIHRDPFESVTGSLFEELADISTLVCVFLDWDEPRKAFVRAVLESGCNAKVFVVRDGATTLPLSGGLEIVPFTPEAVTAGAYDRL